MNIFTRDHCPSHHKHTSQHHLLERRVEMAIIIIMHPCFVPFDASAAFLDGGEHVWWRHEGTSRCPGGGSGQRRLGCVLCCSCCLSIVFVLLITVVKAYVLADRLWLRHGRCRCRRFKQTLGIG